MTSADTGTLSSPVHEGRPAPRTPLSAWRVATGLTAIILTILTIWPILDAGRAALDLVWHPSGDWAVLTLRVEDVGRHTPLVGPYSRFGWNHPGPLLTWLLAIPYHLFGDRPEAILAAAATLNAATVAAMAGVAWRRGRLPLVALTMTTTAVLIHSMGPSMIRDPWNPFVTLLPLALIVLLAWSIVEGDHWMWPPLLFVASFEVQSHIGYLPILAIVALAIAVMAWRTARPNRLLPASGTRRRWVLIISVAVLVGCWYPVLVDQIAGTGNLGAMFRYFLDPGDRPAGPGTAIHIASAQLHLPGAPWLGAGERAGLDGGLLGSDLVALALPVIAMVGSMWLAARYRRHSAMHLQVLVIAATIGGFIATARVLGPVFDWVVRWWWVLAALWWLSIVWALWSALTAALGRRGISSDRFATGALTVIAAVVILAATGPVIDSARDTDPPGSSIGTVLDGFLDPVLDALDGSGPLLVVTTGSVRGDYGDALRLELERAGIDVVAEDNLVSHLGPERSESRRSPSGTLWIVSADAITQFRSDPSMRLLGGWDPLSADERARQRADVAALQDQLIAAGRVDLAEALSNGGGGVDVEGVDLAGVDPALLRRVESARRRGDPVAVFLGPPRVY